MRTRKTRESSRARAKKRSSSSRSFGRGAVKRRTDWHDPAMAIRGSTRLLIATGEAAASEEELPPLVRALIDTASEVLVMTPVLVSRLQWLASDTDRARYEADQRLSTVLSQFDTLAPETTVSGRIGDETPLTAFADAIREFSPDHILIALRSSGGSLRLAGTWPARSAQGVRHPDYRLRAQPGGTTAGPGGRAPFGAIGERLRNSRHEHPRPHRLRCRRYAGESFRREAGGASPAAGWKPSSLNLRWSAM